MEKSVYILGEESRDNKLTGIPKWVCILFLLYIFLSYFEAYLVSFIGQNTRFLMLAIIAVFASIKHGKLKLSEESVAFVLWFAYLCISTIWSDMVNDSPNRHFVALLGNVLFVFVIAGMNFNKDFLRLTLQGHYWVSFIFGLLSIFFHNSYRSEFFEARQVLTLFGEQNDPNNCAAFLLIGVALALYSVIYEKEKIWINLLLVIVNGYAILLTASRAGFLAIGIMVVLFVFLPNQTEKVDIYDGLKKLMFIAIGVSLLVYVGLKVLPSASLNRLIMFEQYSEGGGRTIRWGYALELIEQKPFFGWGWGGYEYIDWGGMHNTFLTLWCDSGIVGFLIFTFPLIMMSINALKSKNILIVVLLICGLIPSFFIDAINKRFLWNAIIVGMMLMNYRNTTGENVRMWETNEKVLEKQHLGDELEYNNRK